MAKTYKLLDHAEPLPADEIRRLYMGYWVYIVKAVFSEYNFMPIIVRALPMLRSIWDLTAGELSMKSTDI